VVDVDPTALERIKGKVQSESCRYFADLDQALDQARSDAALIVSPPSLPARRDAAWRRA
jgi:predicted dehydrogenase